MFSLELKETFLNNAFIEESELEQEFEDWLGA